MFSVHQRACCSDINLWIRLVFLFCWMCKDRVCACFIQLSFYLGNQNEAVLIPNADVLAGWECPQTHESEIWVRPRRCSGLGSAPGGLGFSLPVSCINAGMTPIKASPSSPKSKPKGDCGCWGCLPAFALALFADSRFAVRSGSFRSEPAARELHGGEGCSPGQAWEPAEPCAEARWCQHELRLPATGIRVRSRSSWQSCLVCSTSRNVSKADVGVTAPWFRFPVPAVRSVSRGQRTVVYARAPPNRARGGWVVPGVAQCIRRAQIVLQSSSPTFALEVGKLRHGLLAFPHRREETPDLNSGVFCWVSLSLAEP